MLDSIVARLLHYGELFNTLSQEETFRLSDGYGGETIPTTARIEYDHHELDDFPGSIG